jgi:outer membrane lipoprotein carrier protein
MQKKSKINRGFKATNTSKLLLAALFFILCPLFVCLAEEIPSIDATVEKLQKTYEKTNDFRANFIQEITIKSIKKTEIEEGIVFFKNPRNMLWNYTRPSAKKMVINRQKAWLYLPQEKAAYVQKADSVFQSKVLINFLSGLGKLKDDFAISYAQPNIMDKSGNYLLQLTPLDKSTALNPFQITVDKNTFHILQISFDDILGNSTVLKFSSIVTNTGLSDKIFQFKPPAGTNVFDMP